MSNSKWSALVYGRTYEVDFRLIAMPEDFNNEDKKWALKYILGTTRSPEKLPQQPCWSFFKNDKYCVVGVTCMARELIGDSSNDNAEDFTRDKSTSGGLGRPLYGFFGYVAKLDGQNLPPIPKYLDTNLEAFKLLYDFIKERWYVKNYDNASREPILSKYKELEFDSAKSDSSSITNLKFNSSERKISLWFHSPENANNLWLSASQSSEIISLCIGLSREKDAINSRFLNATVLDINESHSLQNSKVVNKHVKASEQPGNNFSRNESKRDDNDSRQHKAYQQLSDEKLDSFIENRLFQIIQALFHEFPDMSALCNPNKFIQNEKQRLRKILRLIYEELDKLLEEDSDFYSKSKEQGSSSNYEDYRLPFSKKDEDTGENIEKEWFS